MKAKTSLLALAVTGLALIAGVACNKPAKTDAQLNSDVQSKITSDAALQGRQVAASSSDGVVTLTGTVQSDAERIAASNDAAKVDGVKQVLNNLTVAAPQTAEAQQPEAPAQEAPEAAPARRTKPRASTERAGRFTKHESEPAVSSAPQNSNNAMAPAPAAPTVAQSAPLPPPAPRKVSIPDGTSLSIRLVDGLDSERNQAGDTFRATLNTPLTVEDNVVVPDGADLEGRVIEVKSAGHFEGASLLSLELTKLSFNGRSYQIHTNTWQKQGTSRGKNTAAKVGGGAALGAIIGGIAGGGKGAAIGSVIGAGAGTTAQAATHGQQIKLNSEQLLSFTLQSPVTVLPATAINNRGERMQVPTDNQ